MTSTDRLADNHRETMEVKSIEVKMPETAAVSSSTGRSTTRAGVGVQPAVGVTTGRGRVLIMDDDQAVSNVTGLMLRLLGYRETVTAQDGVEALARMEGKSFDLALLDLTIPGGMGGLETARAIRKIHGNNMTLIAISGYSDVQAIAAKYDHGFDGSISKPFTKDDLASCIEKAAQQRSDAQPPAG